MSHLLSLRVLKHFGFVVSTMIAIMWVTSIPLYFHYASKGNRLILRLGYGYLGVTYASDDLDPERRRIRPGLSVQRLPSLGIRWDVRWWSTTYFGTSSYFSIIGTSLWIPFLLVSIPTAILFWRERHRVPRGHCPKCGYDLTANMSGRCPECGTPCPIQTNPAVVIPGRHNADAHEQRIQQLVLLAVLGLVVLVLVWVVWSDWRAGYGLRQIIRDSILLLVLALLLSSRYFWRNRRALGLARGEGNEPVCERGEVGHPE